MQTPVHKRTALSLAVLSWLCLSCQLPGMAAPEETPEYNLETVIVSGSGINDTNENQKKVSINVKDKIDAGQIASVTDLLKDVAGFTVQTSPQGGTQVTMRGLSNDRFLVAINGNVLENQGGLMRGRGLEWDMIPINNVKKIEIIRGASSAAYGGSWGGIVNIVTIQEPGEVKTDIKTSYGSFNTSKHTFANQGTSSDGKFSWTVSANKRESDGFYRNNWSDAKDVNLNLAYQLSSDKKLTFAWTHMERQEGSIVGNRPGSTNGYDPAYPTVPDAPSFGTPGSPWIDGSYRSWYGNNYSVNYNAGQSKLNLFKNEQYRTEWVRTKLRPNLSKSWESNLETQGVSWQNTITRNKHKLTYGIQYNNMDYDLISSQSALKTSMSSVFLQDNWQLRDNVIIGLGARYDRHNLDMTVSNPALTQKPRNDTTSQLSPKLSATYNVNKTEAFFASVSSVFRPPTASDYYRWSGNYFDWSAGSNPRLGAAALGFTTQAQWQQAMGVIVPEHGIAYELGWKKQLNDRLNWRITGYVNDINDYINSYSPPGSKGYPPTYNIKNAKIKGLEVSADYALNDKLTIVSAFTNQIGSKSGDNMDPGGTALNNIPRNTLNVGIRYNNKQGFSAALDTRYTSERITGGTTLGGYTTTDLSFALQRKNSTVSLAINNIFNKKYQETSGYELPGTTYCVAWQTSF